MKNFIACVFILMMILPVRAIGQKKEKSIGKKYAAGRVLVKLRAKPGVSSGENLLRSSSTRNLMQRIGAVSERPVFSNNYKSYERERVGRRIGLDRWIAVTVPVVTNIEKLVADLKHDPDVETAEPDYLGRTHATPNDTYYPSQQHLPQIGAPDAWDVTTGSDTVVIAIIDTGVDWDHPDLTSVIWSNTGEIPGNSTDDDGNGYIDDVMGWDFVDLTPYGTSGADTGDDLFTEDNNPMDYQGHGTHCAGIAGAATNNSTGVASISWGCKIMPIRIGFRTTDGGGSGYMSWMALAFQYAADNGASVASLSFGTSGTAVVDGARYAFENGVVVCNSAGNDDNEVAGALGTQPWVLKVASVDDIDHKASYSTYGSWVNISAPGGDLSAGRPGILSTVVYPSAFYGGQQYVNFQGTSMASPLVAGLAGLVKSRFPALDPPSIVFQICATADNIDAQNPAYAGKLGYGRINARHAVDSVVSPMPPVLSLVYVAFDDAVGGNDNGKIEPGETIGVSVYLKNEWENSTNTIGTISTTAWGISITKSSGNFGTIPGIRDIANSIQDNYGDQFTFTVGPDSIPRNADITLTVTADHGYSHNFNISVPILPSVEFVDDDDGEVNVEDYYTNSFKNIGVSYDKWDHTLLGQPLASYLEMFGTVVWGCEWAFPSLDVVDMTNLEGFLLSGGKLYISGQDLAWDMCSPDGVAYYLTGGASATWYQNYFQAQFVADDAATTTMTGVPLDPIGNGLSLSFTEPLRSSGEQYPDVISPINSAQSVFSYATGGTAMTRVATPYKVVNGSFGGFEAITDPASRDTVMYRIINWLNGNEINVTPVKDTESPDSQKVQVCVTSADTIKSVNLYWDTDGSFPFNKIAMNSLGAGNYEAYIPGQAATNVQYTVVIRTNSGYMPYRIYDYNVGTDNTPPYFVSADSLWNTLKLTGVFSASVTADDNLGVDTGKTYVVFSVNGSAFDSTKLAYAGSNTFSGAFDVHSLASQLHPADVISYYYSICDASAAHNYARYPASSQNSFITGRQLIDNFEQVRAIWDLGSGWGYEISSRAGNTANIAMSDSPGGEKSPINTENTLTLTQPFDLSAYENAKMYFWRIQQVGTGDTVFVEYQKASEGWNLARIMTGTGLATWKKDSVDIPTGASDQVAVRFRLVADAVSPTNGMLLDDIEIVGGTVITGVDDTKPRVIPKQYALRQNFPNPFNPSTVITYELPVGSKVSLKVYDLLGREIRSLVDEHKEAGRYEVTFNARDLPSGIYFYRMQTKDFVSTHKMLLVK